MTDPPIVAIRPHVGADGRWRYVAEQRTGAVVPLCGATCAGHPTPTAALIHYMGRDFAEMMATGGHEVLE